MAQRKEVFVIQKEGEQSYWHKCGVGFVNKDGSINFKLDLFPNVQLNLRDPKEKEGES